MVTYLGGSILITIFALGGSIVSYNLHVLLFCGKFFELFLYFACKPHGIY